MYGLFLELSDEIMHIRKVLDMLLKRSERLVDYITSEAKPKPETSKATHDEDDVAGEDELTSALE